MHQYVEFSQVEVGDSLPPFTKDPVTKMQLVRYAGASGDFNPLHTDHEVAQKAGLRGVIAQGPLIMAFVGQAITRWVEKRHLKRFKVRFMGMTFPGDVITVNAMVKKKTETAGGLLVICEATATDQNGEIKASGQFEILQPIQVT